MHAVILINGDDGVAPDKDAGADLVLHGYASATSVGDGLDSVAKPFAIGCAIASDDVRCMVTVGGSFPGEWLHCFRWWLARLGFTIKPANKKGVRRS